MYHYQRVRRGEHVHQGAKRSRHDAVRRFWAYVSKTRHCWIWTGGIDAGYGLFWLSGGYVRAHRYAYELCVGPIPDGHDVHHRCQNKLCVNPQHLETLTRSAHVAGHWRAKATTAAVIVTTTCLAATTPALADRSASVRAGWLEHRLALHHEQCLTGLGPRAAWHCKAIAWTRRELRQALAEARTLRTRDWVVATALADRVFPGTRRWLLSCSSGEGGHGGFVWNHQGSGAGGWMQFMRSTYEPYAATARAVVRRRGYLVAPYLWGYDQPLGQALTAAYMRWRGISHWHWVPYVDPLCE